MPTLTEVIITPPEPDDTWDPRDLFPTKTSIELEIGSGKGGFILQQAVANPDTGYVGIEWANKYFKYTADRMVRRNIPNVRIMRTDARQLVIRNLPPQCLNALHIYHPDPWPKKRHHRRRLFQKDFIEAVVRVLQPDGLLYIQTDHAEYFEWIKEIVENEVRLIDAPPTKIEEEIPAQSSNIGQRVLVQTNFQIKYQREGRNFYSFIKKNR